MIISSDQNPKYSPYNVGVLILATVNKKGLKKMDVLELYGLLKETNVISINLMIKALDYLFIIGLVKIESDGILCF